MLATPCSMCKAIKDDNCLLRFCRCGSTKIDSLDPQQRQMEGQVVREDVLVCLSRSRKYYQLVLTTTHISLHDANHDSNLEQFVMEDLFGCQTMRHRNQSENYSAAYICFYFYPKSRRKNLIYNFTCRQSATLIFEIRKIGNSLDQNIEIANAWRRDVINILRTKYPTWQVNQTVSKQIADNGNTKRAISALPRDRQIIMDQYDFDNLCELNLSLTRHVMYLRKFLVVLNPKSGQGKSINIFEGKVAPILKECGIKTEVLITQHAGHARHLMSSADLYEFDGIVTVGGDGLLYEVVNGLRCRFDWERVSNVRKNELNSCDEFRSLHSFEIPIGIIAGGSGNGLARSIAEYSGESEEYLRNPVLSTSLAAARGKVRKVNLAEIELDGKTIYSFLSVGWGLLADIDVESEALRALGESRFTIWSFYRLAKLRSYQLKLSYIPIDKEQQDQLNENGQANISSTSPDPVVIKGDFICVYSSYQSYIGSDLFFAPSATPNDGKIHLIYMLGDVRRMKVAQFLSSVDNGKHLDVKGVNYITVKEFTIERDGGIEGHLTIDGEVVSGNRINVKLSPTPLNMFTL